MINEVHIILSKESHNSPLQALFKYNTYLQNVVYQNPYILPTKSIKMIKSLHETIRILRNN